MFRINVMVLVVCLTPLAATAQWPGFRGPDWTGVAVGAKPPATWSAKENVAWKCPLPGPGSSTPIIVGDRIFLTCYTGFGTEKGQRIGDLRHHVICVDRKTGAIAWRVAVAGRCPATPRKVQVKEHGFATPTPVADDDTVYAYLGHAGIIALTFDGAIRWQRSVGRPSENAAARTNAVVRKGKALDLHWGAAASPILHGDVLIVNAAEESHSVRGYDRRTGELLWKRETANLEGCASTPVIAGEGDRAVAVVVLGGEVWALDPATGTLRWRVETGTRGGMSPTAIPARDRVYTFGGGGKSFALRLGDVETKPEDGPADQADATNPRILWQGENVDIPSAVLFDGRLILVRMAGVVLTVDAETGKRRTKGRLDGRTGGIYASPVVAGDRLYVVSRRNGVFVYETDEAFTLVSKNELDDDSQFNASPVFAGNELFLRSDRCLYCIGRGQS